MLHPSAGRNWGVSGGQVPRYTGDLI